MSVIVLFVAARHGFGNSRNALFFFRPESGAIISEQRHSLRSAHTQRKHVLSFYVGCKLQIGNHFYAMCCAELIKM